MWIMTNQGMISVVQHDQHPNVLLVRSRDPETLERFFPEFSAIEMLHADYRWRVFVPRQAFNEALLKMAATVDYPNFKNSVENDELHTAYMGCWSAMHRYQTRVCGPAYDDLQYNLLDDEGQPTGEEIEDAYGPGWPIGEREPERWLHPDDEELELNEDQIAMWR